MQAFLIVLLVLVALPFVGYVTVKLCTFAFYRGRQLFYEDQNQKGNRHGDETKT